MTLGENWPDGYRVHAVPAFPAIAPARPHDSFISRLQPSRSGTPSSGPVALRRGPLALRAWAACRHSPKQPPRSWLARHFPEESLQKEPHSMHRPIRSRVAV